MKFGFKELDQVLATANRVPPEGRTQFAARLRNLFRVGLSLPSGRGGQRTNYGPEDLLKMALAVELLQLGLMPEKAVTLVASYWPEFRIGIFKERLSRKGGQPRNSYIALEPAFMIARELKPGNFHRIAAGSQLLANDRVIRSFRRAAVINLGTVWDAIENSLAGAGLDNAAFLAFIDDRAADMLEERES